MIPNFACQLLKNKSAHTMHPDCVPNLNFKWISNFCRRFRGIKKNPADESAYTPMCTVKVLSALLFLGSIRLHLITHSFHQEEKDRRNEQILRHSTKMCACSNNLARRVFGSHRTVWKINTKTRIAFENLRCGKKQ